MTTATTAAAYLRKSTEDERTAADGKSIERQREGCATFAEKRGWAVNPDHVYVDDGISGAEFVNRAGLQRLLQAVRRRPVPFQALVIAEPSRLGHEQVRQVLRKLGVERVVVKADADGKGWSFEGLADLGHLVNKGAVENP
jgi:DNA invertase Pin-like site-specific DNA recombinase